MRKALAIGGIALALLLAGCSGGPSGTPDTTAPSSSSDSSGDGGYTDDSYGTGGGSDSSSSTALMVASTSLGDVVVTGDGMTAYMYDKDTQGATTSACTGQCLEKWPPILSDEATPKVDGVTGDLGTIDTPDGKLQVTLDGWPLYTFAGDSAKGDVNGQGVGGIWWVLKADGTLIRG
ncbi:hypothetical protein DY023_03460 [Microbacterium bovistercoris]|uniref:Lipoprotein with Yx(FWY)xxD motif n=1 Tax=Microbacterium bovistercoris TaxID=2293570 RepID=A0A371NX17_9MICO|nr:hypothetical protein [Microbacterium bovistercoris]REJ07700.1 hypothetical protein DY023_03460 [Microbacterium bovistercoris]